MVRKYFVSPVEDESIMNKLMDDLAAHPDVETVEYYPFQQKVKIDYRDDVDPNLVKEELVDYLHSYNEQMTLSDDGDLDLLKINKMDIILTICGFLIYGITTFVPIIPSGYSWIGYMIGFVLAGLVLLRRVYISLFKKKKLDENILVLIAIIGAFIIGHYFEALIVLTVYLLAEFLSFRGLSLAKKDIASALHKEQTMAYKVVGDQVILPVPLKEILIGDTILVRPGEMIPLDGLVVEGSGNIDNSTTNKEGYVVRIEPGMQAFSGSMNLDKPLRVAVSSGYHEGVVNDLISKTDEAMGKKSPLANNIEKTGYYYIIAIAVLAVLVIFLGPVIAGVNFLNSDFIYKGLVILAVSSPWAMLIATPIAYNYALTVAKKKGILIKELSDIEILGRLKSIFFSKSGILTTGEYSVKEILPYKDNQAKDVLFYGALAESSSNHPLAKGILKFYGKELPTAEVKLCQEYKGKGTCVSYKDQLILAGNESFLEDNDIEAQIEEEGTLVHVVVAGKYLGAIVLEGTLKDESIETVTKLRSLKLKKIGVLTATSNQVARITLSPLKLRSIFGDLTVPEKIKKIEKEQVRLKGKTVGFVGDSISDGPVMASADVSFAFLEGSLDKVTEAAGVVFLKNDLTLVPESIAVGKKAYRIIKQNLVVSFFIKLVIVLVAIFTNISTGFMIVAIAVDLVVSLLTIVNCLRITKKFGFKRGEKSIQEDIEE